ncbi:hypothetical protein DXG01_013332 [Tephrocybe rancida]|nr:hypothetical protein DXG01_013332 [Tephrocybe rancida]
MSAPNPLTSPSLSTASNASSFIMLSNHIQPPATALSDDSGDEIIYNLSSSDSFLSADDCLNSDSTSEDDDFVVLSRPRSQPSISDTGLSTPKDNDDDSHTGAQNVADLAANLATLSVANPAPRRRKAKTASTAVIVAGAVPKKKRSKKVAKASPVNAAAAYPSPGPSPARPKRVDPPTASTSRGQQVSRPRLKQGKKTKLTGLGGRSIVDDASDRFSDYGESDAGSPSMYEEAFSFITSFLSNPEARKDSVCRLTLLQALIVELGLASSSLPSSLKAAKAYLKSRAFLNIREYIAVRDQGPAAVQRIMHPSRSALIKDIRKKKNKAPLGWVKDSGLNVLLVQCY